MHGSDEKYKVLGGKPEGKRYFGDTGLERNIILKCVYSKWDINMWTGVP
jgi:hypothetical protein